MKLWKEKWKIGNNDNVLATYLLTNTPKAFFPTRLAMNSVIEAPLFPAHNREGNRFHQPGSQRKSTIPSIVVWEWFVIVMEMFSFWWAINFLLHSPPCPPACRKRWLRGGRDGGEENPGGRGICGSFYMFVFSFIFLHNQHTTFASTRRAISVDSL